MRLNFRAVALAAGALLTFAPVLASALVNDQQLTSVDKAFLPKAIAAGYLEVAQGMAMQKSRDAKVRMYAKMMVHDHGALNTQLATIAKDNGVAYSAKLPRVGAMSPRAYMQAQVAAHQAAVSMFKDEAKNGSHGTLHTVVGDALPNLESHLAMAQEYLAGKPMVRATPGAAQNNVSPH